MTDRARQAQLFNEAIAQGLSEDQALVAAGITDPSEFTYGFGTGKLEPLVLGSPARPGVTTVPPGANIDYGDDEDTNQTTNIVGSQTTNTVQETVTGGSETTTRYTPTTYRDTAQSSALSAEAASLAVQKEQRAAALRAEGKTGAEILRDPEYRSLSRQQQEKLSAAQEAKEVAQAGAVTVTTAPGPDSTTYQQTVDQGFLTNDTAGQDEEVENQQLNRFGTDNQAPENFDPEPIPSGEDPYVDLDDGGENIIELGATVDSPEPIPSGEDPYVDLQDEGENITQFEGTIEQSQEEANAQYEAMKRAQSQATLQKWRKQANDGDWRVRLRLAPNATYLYKAPEPGILQPLSVTDGVIFPYTPRINTVYRAEYSDYKLTHSNYRGFFYQSSYVDDIQLEATFTAQDTAEAEYLLAVIHFFRSATKMFYGAQDPMAGSPPPVVYLQGLGEYQFNLQSCVIAQFNYNLPNDVDYIRARSKNISTNTALQYLQRRQREDLPTNPFTSAWSRIENVLKPQGVSKGAVPDKPAPPTLGVGDGLNNNPTYVPTKIDVTLVLHPIQSRQQVSREFNMQNFANGNLLRGGFW